MPIYEQTYRRFEGDVVGRFRWWIIVKQEIRVLLATKIFVALFLIGLAQFFLRLMQVVTVNILTANPNNPITWAMRSIDLLNVDAQMYFDFLRLQGGFVFLLTIAVGSGYICNDFRYNLIEVYFSKPISWKDYALGKIATLLVLGLALTAAPALIVNALHFALNPSWDRLQEVAGLILPITVFSVCFVGTCALGVLASSALFSSQRFASIAVFMVVLGNMTIIAVLSEALKMQNFLVGAVPLAIQRIGEELFNTRHQEFSLHWQWPAMYVAAVCALCAWIIFRRAKRAGEAI